MKARTRTLLLSAAAGIALLALVLAAIAWAMFPPERLTPLVRDGLSRSLGAPVVLGRASLRLFPPVGVRLEALVIGDPRGYARPATWPKGGVAEAKSVDASVDLFALLSRRLRLTSLRLEDARVSLVRNEQGLGNWEGLAPRTPGARPQGPAFDVSLDRFELARARVTYYDARDGGWIDVRRVDGTLAFRTGGGGRDQRVRLAARASGIGGHTPLPIGAKPIAFTADVEGQGNGARWIVRQAGIARGALKLSGHGSVEGPDQVLAFRLDQATLPLDALLEFLPREESKALGRLEGKGDVQLALEANGPLSHGRTPAVRARARLANGRLAFRDRGLAIEGLACELAATDQGADLTRLTGRVGRSTFEITGVLRSYVAPRMRTHVRAALDLAEVARFLPLADSTKLAGVATLGLDGAGAPGPDFGWSGAVDLKNVSAAGVGLGYPVTGVNGRIGLSPGRAWATGLAAQLGRSDMTIDATVEKPFAFAAQATGTAKRRDPGAVLRFALVSRSIDGDQLFPARADTSALPRVRAEGTFRVGAFRMQKLEANDVTGRVTYQDGVAQVEDCALAAYGGHARGTAWFDLTQRARPRYVVHATADQVDANRLLSAWTPAKNVAFGALQMKLDLDGAGITPADVAKSLSATGLAQVLGGKLAGAPVFAKLAEFTGVDRFRILSFRDLSAPFHVTDGRVVFDPIALATGGTDWLANGSVGLDGTLAFDVAALVPSGEVAALPKGLASTAGSFLAPDGKLTLDLKLGGSVTRPTFAWDKSRTASRLLAQGQASLTAMTQKLTGTLADTLAASRAEVEARAQAAADEQKRKLEAEVEKQKQEMANKAMEQLDALFRKKTAPPPPPADSGRAAPDTARAGTPPPAAPDSAASAAP